MINAPEIVKIIKIREENPITKTLVLCKKISAFPGQFFMVWVPDVGEKPFSFSKVGKETLEITVREVGHFTEKLCNMKEGDLIGVRGPYGDSPFISQGKNICIVAGGIGISPLLPLIENKKSKNKFNSITVLLGAKNKDELLFIDRIKKACEDCIITTEDGSAGEKGLCVDCLERIIKEKNIDQIYTCGPEPMMKKVMEIALKKKISCQLSLERYMKCGIGICGTCCLDPKGLRVCKDGPVFTTEELKGSEFGEYKRDSSGSKIRLYNKLLRKV
jgi:dihydroorotate dehydrogenase electron transfer subunit